MLLGREKFKGVDIRVRVRGGGHVSQVYGKLKTGNKLYLKRDCMAVVCILWCENLKVLSFIPFFSHTAIRQAISKSLVAYYQKCMHYI